MPAGDGQVPIVGDGVADGESGDDDEERPGEVDGEEDPDCGRERGQFSLSTANHECMRRAASLTGILQPFHDEDALQQEADAQPDQRELHRVDELAPKQLQEHVLRLLLADLRRMVAQPAAGDDPEVERALPVVDDQGSQDGPVVPPGGGALQAPAPEAGADGDGDEHDEEHIDPDECAARR